MFVNKEVDFCCWEDGWWVFGRGWRSEVFEGGYWKYLGYRGFIIGIEGRL